MEFQPTLLVKCMSAVRSVVLAAEARKAESASVEAQRPPRPPSLTDKDAWSQRSRQSPRSGWLINLLLVSRQIEPSSDNQHRQQCAYCISALGHSNCFSAEPERHVCEVWTVF